MLAKVISGAVMGVEAYRVEIEVNAGSGDTALTHSSFTAGQAHVGLPQENAKNAKTER